MYKYRTRLTSVIAILVGITISPVHVLAQTTSELTEAAVAMAAEATTTENEEMIAWEAVQQSGESQDVFAFIEAHPNGQHIKDAKALMIDLLWLELANDSPTPAPVVENAAAAVPDDQGVETQEIELRSSDGLVALTGVITDFDDTLITIQTSQGVLGIQNEGIACIGAACPPELLGTP